MVNFEWYRSFITVYRVGTVSGAAQVLHLTQPAVSQHLAALEAALAIPLFQRTPRRMVPTEGGIRLYNQIAEAIERLESVDSRMSLFAKPPIIRLGAPQEFFVEKMLGKIPLSNTNYYTVKFGLSQELIEQLLAGNLDYVVSTVKLKKADLVFQPLFKENFWLVGAKDLEIPNYQENLSILESWLKTQPIIAYSEELPIIRRFWRIVFGRRIDINPKLIIPDLRGIRQGVEYGLGCSILPDYLCESWVKDNRLQLILNPVNAVTNEIWLAFSKSDIQMPQTQFLCELFNEK
jgi:DNA-binding transcriptional LysR family regulator